MRIVLLLIPVFVLLACNTKPSENGEGSKKADTLKMSESIRMNMSFLHDFNALEQMFGNENWLIADKKDSSYLYFSRLGNFIVNTFAYKRVKGDSAAVQYGTIQPENNSITWNLFGRKLFVSSATGTRVKWSAVADSLLQYEFIRLDDNHIQLVYPDKKKLILQKVLPLSLFLVRSRYDYTHGTKYAFDSSRAFDKRK